MRVLVDTNILLRAVQTDHPQTKTALDAVRRLTDQQHELCIVPQVIYEFWAAATRPARENGLGRSTAESKAHAEKLR